MRPSVVGLVLAALLWAAAADGEPVRHEAPEGPERRLVLTRDSEEGFRRFMAAVRDGRLGADVREVNVGVSGGRVRVEILRRGAPDLVVRLGPPTSAARVARRFDVEAVENASADDLARIGRLLDEVFATDPFLEEPSLRGDSTDAPQRDELRRMRTASRAYAIAVVALGGLGLLASLGVLGLSAPAREERSDRA